MNELSLQSVFEITYFLCQLLFAWLVRKQIRDINIRRCAMDTYIKRFSETLITRVQQRKIAKAADTLTSSDKHEQFFVDLLTVEDAVIIGNAIHEKLKAVNRSHIKIAIRPIALEQDSYCALYGIIDSEIRDELFSKQKAQIETEVNRNVGEIR